MPSYLISLSILSIAIFQELLPGSEELSLNVKDLCLDREEDLSQAFTVQVGVAREGHPLLWLLPPIYCHLIHYLFMEDR